MSQKFGRLSLAGGFAGAVPPERCETASSTHGSGPRSPHLRLLQTWADVGLYQLGHGLRNEVGVSFTGPGWAALDDDHDEKGENEEVADPTTW